ncbi:unnamed protein product [Protopolystoma xenopodis]|uniref:Uncharacterized protein n=1 Tax=Protopolystoma xenopodis TaxID=117903 RepID=A0A448WQC9_9PLAT|nr:unnamed protein product [Protopolystoma xenopodis]
MVRRPDDADYNAGEMSASVLSSRSDSGNYHGYYGFRTRYCLLDLI